MTALLLALLLLLAGSLVFSVLMILAAWRFARVPAPPAPAAWPPVSLVTPIAGRDLGLEANLRSSFLQDYPAFELVFAVRSEDEPAVPLVRKLISEHPGVPARLVIAGEPQSPNAKVHNLDALARAARHDLLLMNDSDIYSPPGTLATIAAEFAGSDVALATLLSTAVAGRGWAARLEALLMNTQFMGGVLVARMLEGVKFALGPSAAVRRAALDSVGGWQAFQHYLAEDFMLGNRIAATGATVILSSARTQHRIGDAGWGPTMQHRLRWARSTRRSRPKGYIGEVFCNPIPIALLLALLQPAAWLLLPATVLVRYVSCYAVASWALRDRLALRDFWAIPIQDLIHAAVWILGFFGNKITWRGYTYMLMPDGTFRPAARQPGQE